MINSRTTTTITPAYHAHSGTMLFTVRRSYASAVLGVLILSVRLLHACFVTKTKQRTADILTPHERAITLLFWHHPFWRPLPSEIGPQSGSPPSKSADFDRFRV